MIINSQIPTPYFAIDKNKLDSLFSSMVSSFSEYFGSRFLIGYSFKTNSLPWIVDYFRAKGCYAEVVSDDEYRLADIMGFDKEKRIYNGPIKTKDTFSEAVRNGCIVNVDTQREIRWLGEIDSPTAIPVGIRVNFDLEAACPGQSQCPEEGGRFGFCYENGSLETAINDIRKNNGVVRSIHLHCSSKTRSLDIYRAISEKACEIAEKYGLDPEYIDIGGGFFGGLPGKPSFSDYARVVHEELKKHFDLSRITVVIEPGMALIGAPVSFVTSVIDTKATSFSVFAVTDGSRTNVDPFMKKTGYFYDIIPAGGDTDRKTLPKQIVCGFTCMENDRLFTLENGQELLPGDIVVYRNTGAYTMCLSPLFIRYFPDVYVIDDDGYRLVRRRWNANDYISGVLTDELTHSQCGNTQ